MGDPVCDNVKYYKPKFQKWIDSPYWDSIVGKLYDTDIAIVEKVMQAKNDGDCNWLVWSNCDYVLERIKMVYKKILFFNR